jgi:3-deoxy-D-manno-octulosonic-acid transferase
MMWQALYNVVVIPLLWMGAHAALFNSKIRRGLYGRRNLFQQLERDVQKLKHKRRIWFHSSSMGEFEQAKPIIAALRNRYKEIEIIASFFSPSGYDHSKNYKLASLITYIPFDTKANAARFIDLIKPTAAVMVRYDVWPNHIWALRERNIPTFIANATMKQTSTRLRRSWRGFNADLFNQFCAILTVSQQDADAFAQFNLSQPQVQAVGETRYDQVWQRSIEARTKHVIPLHVLKRKKIFVVGSSWEEDEDVVVPTFRKLLQYDNNALMILVPHEPTLEALENIEIKLGIRPASIRFSDLNDYDGESVVLVDSVGILMALYQYAHVAYVGGSFRQGVHNVLEPAVYGIPVLYGPKHENSQEAVELAKRGGGFVVRDQQECYRVLRSFLRDNRFRREVGEVSLALVKENIGATERFLKHLEAVI